MNRGYAGFYRGFYLRSSYEYAYAKYLDYHSIQWGYEDQVFDLGYRLYKPDFFIYDNNGNVCRIVEVKSRNKKEIEKALNDLTEIHRKYGIECELVSYEKLRIIYEHLPFTLTGTIEEWINSNETTISKVASGSLNGHYSMKHREDTKKKIGEHTKKLWETDSYAKQRMLEGLRKSGLSQKGKIKIPREKRVCKNCGDCFTVIKTSSRKFCSQSCAGENAIKKATEVYVSKREILHVEIRDYTIQWSKLNKEIVLNAKLNKVSTVIAPLLNEIHDLFGVKDLRVISKAVFGKDLGRKELLKFMKSVCNENVC